MITIISDIERESIGTRLYELLLSKQLEVRMISASNRDIKPCYACNGCFIKTYGKCVFRDDMDEILSQLASSNMLIYTTPNTWGGPSYATKKILDKSALIGNRFYKVRHGELVKGVDPSTAIKKMVVIGVDTNLGEQTKKDFIFWGHEVLTILDLKGITRVVPAEISEDELRKLAEDITKI